MKKSALHWLIFLYSIFLLYGFNNVNAQISNIESFAKLYGYVRWFYPGDEASQIDWNKFAVYGIQKVENAKDKKELKQILLELFKPIAPALKIFDSSETVFFNKKSLEIDSISDLKSISWIHSGVNLGERSNIYKSIRVNRDTSIMNHIAYLNDLSQKSLNIGQEYKLSVKLKSANQLNANAFLFLLACKTYGVYPENKNSSYAIGTTSIGITSRWGKYEKIIKADPETQYLLYGLGPNGNFELLVDSISLFLKANGIWQLIYNHVIEQDFKDFSSHNPLYEATIDKSDSLNSNCCLKISPSSHISKLGDFIQKNIGNNLIITMPLVLLGNKSQTFPASDLQLFNKLKEELKNITDSSLCTQNPFVKLANVVIAWNVFQHFYPYFSTSHVDWKKVLTQTLESMYMAKLESDYFISMSQMVAQLKDGHGAVFANNLYQWGLPIKVDLIENKIVITDANSNLFQKGDIIESVDGKKALEELEWQESLISGSLQLKRYRGLNMFGSDFLLSEAEIKLLRDTSKITIKIIRRTVCNIFYNKIGEKDDFILGLNDNNSFSSYKDLGENELGNLIQAKGIIVTPSFDLKKLIPHLIQKPVYSTKFEVPVQTHPDGENVFYLSNRWYIKPQQPFIKAKAIFLINPSVVSYGETFLSFIDQFKLGILVGDTTAGANGNINIIPLIGGYSIMWTGMKVLKHDGSQFDFIGYKPEYPVFRTINAIKENRDEFIEKAKELLKEKVENP